MKRLTIPVWLIVTLGLAGCSFSSPTPAPTPKPTTGMFIRVPTPTALPSRTPTLQPTQVVTPTVTIPTETPAPVTVTTLPDPYGYSWQLVVSGLDKPVCLVNAGDGTGRLFIIEQAGLVRILKDGAILPTPFLDLTQKVDCCGEKGLLGLVFHPKYTENGYFYVNYTEKVNNKLYSVISRFSISPADPNLADPGSEMRMLHIEQPFQNHNGGDLHFGPDGYLYIGLGDGGSFGDPLGNGQSLDTLLGKILRLDVDTAEPYAIPPENPYANGGGLWEIWLSGLRNPWRFSFDRLTGDLYIGDVGQDAWEEIDYLPVGSPGGVNLGWNYFEGTHSYRSSPPLDAQFIMPVAEYGHAVGNSVTGGYVYRGKNLPAWTGVYLYGDFSSGRVWGLLRLPDSSWQNALMFETGHNISAFGVDENGEIYLVDYNGSILNLR